MTDVTFTFRLDPALKEEFLAIADEQDLSAAQILRKMMREAVEKHQEGAAHQRWLRREIEDAMHETSIPRSVSMSNEAVETEWQCDRNEIARRDGT